MASSGSAQLMTIPKSVLAAAPSSSSTDPSLRAAAAAPLDRPHHSFIRMMQTQTTNTNNNSTTTTTTQTNQSCAPPPPQNTSHYNSITNETMYYTTQVEVHEIGMIYYYEIHHAEGVSWEDVSDSENANGSGGESVSGTIGDWIDTAQNFFGGMFDDSNNSDGQSQQIEGTEVEEEGGTDESSSNIGGGNAKLTRLEKYMASELWRNVLNDDRMTWTTTSTSTDDNAGEEEECAGLVIDDETTSATVEEEVTKLLGLTHEPLDYVNPDGCTVPDPTCTSILGQVSVAYSGPNEYGVIQHVIEQIKLGMEDGSFIPPNSPALTLEFLKAGDTAPVSESGQVISLTTARGMEEPSSSNSNEESYLSRYGVLFVCFVAILGTGFIAATVFRYKKRQRRAKEGLEEGVEEIVGGDRDVTFPTTTQEPSSSVVNDDDDNVSDLGSSTRTDSTGITSRVELLEVPAVDSGTDSQDVEMSYSPRTKKSRRRKLDGFGREG